MDPHNHHVIGLQMRLNHLVIPTRPTIAKHCPRIPSTSPLIDADLALSQFERFFPPKNYSALTFPPLRCGSGPTPHHSYQARAGHYALASPRENFHGPAVSRGRNPHESKSVYSHASTRWKATHGSGRSSPTATIGTTTFAECNIHDYETSVKSYFRLWRWSNGQIPVRPLRNKMRDSDKNNSYCLGEWYNGASGGSSTISHLRSSGDRR